MRQNVIIKAEIKKVRACVKQFNVRQSVPQTSRTCSLKAEA